MSAFTDLIQSRRSAMNFVEGVIIPQNELEEMFSYARLAPSAYNLQHTNYKVISNESLKKKFAKQLTANIKSILLQQLL